MSDDEMNGWATCATGRAAEGVTQQQRESEKRLESCPPRRRNVSGDAHAGCRAMQLFAQEIGSPRGD